MRLLNRKDLFYVEFTNKFIPEEIENFYKPYIKSMPTQIESPRKLIETSLQGVSVPSSRYDAVSQHGVDTFNKNAIYRNLRSTFNPQELSEKSLTLTFKLLNGYINYWILTDTFNYHYDMKNPNAVIGDISLRILDSDGLIMFTRVYKDCLLTGISDLELSYSENLQTFETFTITVVYSTTETTFANPGNTKSWNDNPSKFSGKIN
jgi:hypothetical protein